MNDYEKELVGEFGQGDSPIEGVEIYLTKCLNDASIAISVLCKAYQVDLWEMPMEERTDDILQKKEDSFFYMLDCIKLIICRKFNDSQEGYNAFCKYEDEKMEARMLRHKHKQESDKDQDEEES